MAIQFFRHNILQYVKYSHTKQSILIPIEYSIQFIKRAHRIRYSSGMRILVQFTKNKAQIYIFPLSKNNHSVHNYCIEYSNICESHRIWYENIVTV